MSLTDKIVKNTAYYFLSQIIGLIFPLILTPFIISKIGQEEFAIYALMFGFIGGFSLFDLSISSSFVKFISEHYFRKENDDLNKVINTGTFFYILFAAVTSTIVFFSIDYIVSHLNVPPDLRDKAMFALYISLSIFFITSATSMFSAIITSLQKMYLNSITWVIINMLNTISIVILLTIGYGLKAVLICQLAAFSLSTVLTIYFASINLPEMKFSISYLKIKTFKKLFSFGIQMQISKLATFASEKYDEFLLAYFSVLNNVTYFNVGARISRLGKFLPSQLIPQTAPVAAELKSREETEKLTRLFNDTTRYLSILSFPVFIFIFIFSDLIIYCWVGNGFEISSHILKVLIAGQLINMVLSAPGNSITPNIGLPKYQMREGLINLVLNLVFSFVLIKYYGIIGAAWGNTAATIIAALYVFYVSAKYFKVKHLDIIKSYFIRPVIVSFITALFLFILRNAAEKYSLIAPGRIAHIISLVTVSVLYTFTLTVYFLNSEYINQFDKEILVKILVRVFPLKALAARRKRKFLSRLKSERNYTGELVSIMIVTYNRRKFIEKCLSSLLPTLKDINYEMYIWDNNSSDGTIEYINKLASENPGIKAVFSDKNIGTGAKGKLAEMTKGEYIIGIDDDVWSFPGNWVQDIIYAFNSIPQIGYLAADVYQDETTTGAKAPENAYKVEYYDSNKICLLNGPAGGWCFLISRDVYKKTGKFASPKNRIFYGEDGDYLVRMIKHGFKFGILRDLKVYHATGPVHNKLYPDIFETKMKDLRKNKAGFINKTIILHKWLSIGYYINKLLDMTDYEIQKEESGIG